MVGIDITADVVPTDDGVFVSVCVQKFVVALEPRPSLFTQSVITRTRAECNCVWVNSTRNG